MTIDNFQSKVWLIVIRNHLFYFKTRLHRIELQHRCEQDTHGPVPAGSGSSVWLGVGCDFSQWKRRERTLRQNGHYSNSCSGIQVMKQKEKFKLIKISSKPPAFNRLTFKYGTWAGAWPRLGRQKGTLVIITSTHHCKNKTEEWTLLSDSSFTFSCFVNCYKFRGYQNCTTTIVTQPLLCTKTFGLGKIIQLTPGRNALCWTEWQPQAPSWPCFQLWSHRHTWHVMKTGNTFFLNQVFKSSCFLKISILQGYFCLPYLSSEAESKRQKTGGFCFPPKQRRTQNFLLFGDHCGS